VMHHGDGYDTVDVDAARRLGIGVSNTPDVFNDAVADTAVGLMLSTIRGLCAADRYVRSGRWSEHERYPAAREMSRMKVGILGLGRIGSAIATRLLAFRCAISYHNRHEIPACPYHYATSPVELADSVEALVVATPGGNGTEKLVGRPVLEALGPDGYLINIARGNVADEQALVELLVDGRLAGAGLDVFAHEPDVPTELRELTNLVTLPHIGGATQEAMVAAAELVRKNLDQFLTHGTLITPVVPPVRRRAAS
jgi:lactate dehydrogenase-like 2-hydroxyacid dehydrogenase